MSKTITIRQEQKDCYSAIRVDVADFADFVQRMQSLPIDAIFPSSWVKAGLLTMGDHGVHILTPRGEDLLASAHLIPDAPEPEQPSAPPCEACDENGEQTLLISKHPCDVCHGSKVKLSPLTSNSCRDMPEPRRGHAFVAGYQRVLDSLGFAGALDGTHPQYSPQCHRVLYPLRGDDNVATLNPFYATHAESGRVSSSRPNASSLPRSTTHEPSEPSNPWTLIDSEEVARSFVGKRVEIDAPYARGYVKHPTHQQIDLVVRVAGSYLQIGSGGTGLNWRSRGNVRLRVVDGDSHE